MKKNNETGWEAFYTANQTRPASPLLRRALGEQCLPVGNGHAVDLGCGSGIETAMLSSAGWSVLAIDKEPRAIERVEALKAELPSTELMVWASSFEELESLPPSALIHAGLSLPFCHPTRFSALWGLVRSALEPGGVFAGHLFGNGHDWATNSGMNFHSKREVEALCDGLEIELLRESEGEGGLVLHHWHRFDLILRKPRRRWNS
ncbi:class I SAM-dependent methyltransferase [Halomonas sp. HNIBRBA4712]|uniref:class I SAM-dependent methyltransferase n=1 Tax=Halomonas sp. HNIBRBA4712 TaxID=3373087 RepID=UPI0037463D18